MGCTPEVLGADDIAAMIRHIAQCLSTPRRFVLFGGCAMCVDGAKDSTMDVDLLVIPPSHYGVLIRDLERASFTYLRNEAMEAIDPTTDTSRLEAMEMFWYDGSHHDWRLDLFPPHAIWHRGLQWTDEMDRRAKEWFRHGNADLWIADASSIFLLKAVTGRWRTNPLRDVPDMAALIASGRLDWAFIASEWRRQTTAGIGNEAVAMAQEAVQLLRASGRHVPWEP